MQHKYRYYIVICSCLALIKDGKVHLNEILNYDQFALIEHRNTKYLFHVQQQ